MIVFGDNARLTSPRAELAALSQGAGALSTAGGGLRRHEGIVALFVDASELAQGLADAETERVGRDADTPLTGAATALLSAFAEALVRSWCSGFADQAVLASRPIDELLGFDLPASITAKRAEGYAYYALYPEAYAEAAKTLADAPPLHIVGIRSIGLGLACIVAAATGAARPASVRPIGHPFQRRLNVAPTLARAIAPPSDHCVAIVDEGPGLSGSSFAAVADLLEEGGVERDRICVFASHGGDLGPQASDRNRARWTALSKPFVRFEDLLLSKARPEHRLQAWLGDLVGEPVSELVDIAGGRWRAAHGIADNQWPPADIQMERRKFLVRARSGGWFVKFAGLGRYGTAKLERAQALAAAGFGPEVRGMCHGFTVEGWVAGSPLRPDAIDRDALLARIASYLAFRSRKFHAPERAGASLAALAEMAVHNVGEGLGHEASAALDSLRGEARHLEPSVRRKATDNRMQAWEWLVTPVGRIIKTDGLDHCEAHDLIGCQDITWDIAGVSAEFDLSADETGNLCDIIGNESGEEPDRRLLAFSVPCYLAFQLGAYTMAAQANSHLPLDAGALTCQADRYRHRLQLWLNRTEPRSFT